MDRCVLKSSCVDRDCFPGVLRVWGGGKREEGGGGGAEPCGVCVTGGQCAGFGLGGTDACSGAAFHLLPG